MVRDFLLQLNFHEKIKFDLSEASKMLELIYKREIGDLSNKVSDLKQNAMFGPNKVSALINWLKGFEWISSQKNSGYVLTDLGKLIINTDIELNSEITHFIMHYHMCKNSIFWNFFISRFLPNNTYFSKKILLSRIQDEFKINKQGDATKHIKPLFDFYLKDIKINVFEKDLLSLDDQYIFSGVIPSNIYVLLYCLHDWWTFNFDGKDSVLRSELIETNESFTKILGMQQSESVNWLSKLHQMQFIFEHLAVAPYTIDKRWNINNLEMIKRAYEQQQ